MRDDVHDTFPDESPFISSRTTISPHGCFVCQHTRNIAGVVFNLVGSTQNGGGPNRRRTAMGTGIGAHVVEQGIHYSGDRAVTLDSNFYAMPFFSCLIGGLEVFASILDPSYRLPQSFGEKWY